VAEHGRHAGEHGGVVGRGRSMVPKHCGQHRVGTSGGRLRQIGGVWQHPASLLKARQFQQVLGQGRISTRRKRRKEGEQVVRRRWEWQPSVIVRWAMVGVAGRCAHLMFVTVSPLADGEVESCRLGLVVTFISAMASDDGHADLAPDLRGGR